MNTYKKPYIIAEIGCNHKGEMDIAKELVKVAKIFCNANAVRFHDRSGSGYKFLADNILKLDSLNPQVAARMSNAFSQWRRYDNDLQKMMRNQMERIVGEKNISRDVYEVMSKSLSD